MLIDIFNELFLKKNRVLRRDLVKYLINRGIINDEAQISGIDFNINNSMSSYTKFYSLFNERMKEDKYKDMTEDIIFLCTV